MRNIPTKLIQTVGQIDDIMITSKTKIKTSSNFKPTIETEAEIHNEMESKLKETSEQEEIKCFNQIRDQYKLFEYVSSGDDNNINFIRNYLEKDIELHKNDRSNLIINKLDPNGKSLLYNASIYGNINMVMLLREYGADVYYRCKVI